MIPVIIICHHQDPGQIELATRSASPYRVLVIDRSPEIIPEGFEHIIRNTEGEGFLAGRMRNMGTAKALELWPELEAVVYFDCDRVPDNIPTSWAADVVLYMGQNDAREEIAGDVTAHCSTLNSPFYSGGFYLSRKALDELGGVPFDPAFDGLWGWEDADLGDRLAALGFQINLSHELKVSGEFKEPEWIHTAPTTDPRFRNWHTRLNKRRNMEQQFSIPETTLNKIAGYLASKPYGEVHELFAALNGTIKRLDAPAAQQAPEA